MEESKREKNKTQEVKKKWSEDEMKKPDKNDGP